MATMKRLDVGDAEVTYTWKAGEWVILSVTPHYDGAEIGTEDEILESIMDYESDLREANRSEAMDRRFSEYEDRGY